MKGRLTTADIITVFTRLVSSGTADWIAGGKEKERIYVWWRSVSDWAAALWAYVSTHGLQGQVCTVYELRERSVGPNLVFLIAAARTPMLSHFTSWSPPCSSAY